MNAMIPSLHNIKRNLCLFCSILFLSLLLFSCAVNRQSLAPEDFPIIQPDALESLIEDVRLLIMRYDYETAAEMLRSVGRQEYSYYRMDEILFYLGQCNLELGEVGKASKCFSLLNKYYPRSSMKFSLLFEFETRTSEALFQQQQRDTLENIDERTDSSTESHDGPLISNSFYETDIRQALMDLSAQSGVAIIPDAMIHGYISMELIDVPLEQALSILLSPLGYSYRYIDNYYIVGSPEPDNPSFPLLAETRVIKPKHLPAEDVPKLIPDYYNNFLKINNETNTLTISAPPDIIARFEEELSAIDHPPQQIMLEAVVVEMGEEARRSLGLDWDWTGTKANNTFQISKLIPAPFDSSSFLGELFKADEVKDGLTFDLRLALRALALQDDANIRANPRVVTMDGHQATIRIGREAYYSIVQGSSVYSYATLEKIATGISLQITPYVGENADIITDIFIEVSDVTGSGATDLPVTSVRSVQTKVEVANGQTIGVGGLVSENTREQRNRIPFLGDIPYLGYLFGNTTTVKEKTEIVVLITPHLLINPREFDDL